MYKRQVFRHLIKDDLEKIIDIELAKVRERLLDRGITLTLSDESKAFIIENGTNLEYGARPLRRAIESYIEDPLSEELLKGEFKDKNTVTVEVKEVGDTKQLVFNSAQSNEPELAGVGDETSDS